MIPKWIDISGTLFLASQTPVPHTFDRYNDGSFVYGTVARYTYGIGKASPLNDYRGKVVRAVDIYVDTETSIFVYSPSPATNPAATLLSFVPDVPVIQARIPAWKALANGHPPRRTNGVEGPNESQATGTWPYLGDGWSFSDPISRNTLSFPVGHSDFWVQKGTYTLNVADTTVPLFELRPSSTDVDDFGGLVLDMFLADVNAAMKIDPARVRFFISDKPGWTGLAPSAVGEGLRTSAYPLVVHAEYPDGTKVMGLAIEVSTSGGKVQIAPYGSSYFSASEVNYTDANGDAKFEFLGVTPGTASIIIRVANDPTNQRALLFNPPLYAGFDLEVYGVSPPIVTPDPPPAQPPPPVRPPFRPPPEPPHPPVVDAYEPDCVTYPAVEAIAAVPGYTITTPVAAWDAGANSIAALDGNVHVTLTMPIVVGVVVGFTQTRLDPEDYTRITHGYQFAQTEGGSPLYRVIEEGRARTPYAAYVPNTTSFEVRRANGVVSYWVDADRVYVSREPLQGEVIVGSSLYASGDTIP